MSERAVQRDGDVDDIAQEVGVAARPRAACGGGAANQVYSGFMLQQQRWIGGMRAAARGGTSRRVALCASPAATAPRYASSPATARDAPYAQKARSSQERGAASGDDIG